MGETVTGKLRAAVLAAGEAGLTRYRIAKDTGISQAALSRFVNGSRGLDGSSIDTLADYLGLELVAKVKATRKAAKRSSNGKPGKGR